MTEPTKPASGPAAGEATLTEPDAVVADPRPEVPRRPRSRHGARSKSGTRNLLEWVAVVIGALVVALVVRTFLFQAFFIPSPSMLPTLAKGDRVIVNKLSYRFGEIERGDIVVFERPPGVEQENKDLIKRVVATEGDTVTVADGRVLVDGTPLDEPYLTDGVRTEPLLYPYCEANLSRPLTVPEDQVLVMGDNRANSLDGRCFGPIDEDLIVGRAFVRVWPLNRLEVL